MDSVPEILLNRNIAVTARDLKALKTHEQNVKNNSHILIVEDSPDLQLLLTQLLSGEGYRISCAFNGQQALDFLQTTSELPALILLDIMMPVMDGFEFRDAQKQDPRIAEIPFIVMTADYNAKAHATQMGAVEVLQKPLLDIDRLIATAARLSHG